MLGKSTELYVTVIRCETMNIFSDPVNDLHLTHLTADVDHHPHRQTWHQLLLHTILSTCHEAKLGANLNL